MYCHPMDPSLANKTVNQTTEEDDEGNGAHHVHSARAAHLLIAVTCIVLVAQVIK